MTLKELDVSVLVNVVLVEAFAAPNVKEPPVTGAVPPQFPAVIQSVLAAEPDQVLAA